MAFEGFDVVTVDAGGLASKAGLRPGDVILTVNGLAARSGDDLRRIVAGGGAVLALRVDRSGRTHDLELRLKGAK